MADGTRETPEEKIAILKEIIRAQDRIIGCRCRREAERYCEDCDASLEAVRELNERYSYLDSGGEGQLS